MGFNRTIHPKIVPVVLFLHLDCFGVVDLSHRDVFLLYNMKDLDGPVLKALKKTVEKLSRHLYGEYFRKLLQLIPKPI